MINRQILKRGQKNKDILYTNEQRKKDQTSSKKS